MALIDLDELKEVLGIGDIYADAIVQEVADSAENVLLPYLTRNEYAVIAHERLNNINKIYFDRYSDAYVGQTIVVSGCGSTFNGSKTITATNGYWASWSHTAADYPKHNIIPSGVAKFEQYVDYDLIPEVREAALAIAADIWISRQGQLGQQGLDFQPAPYKLGRAMISRVSGLLGKYFDVRSMVG